MERGHSTREIASRKRYKRNVDRVKREERQKQEEERLKRGSKCQTIRAISDQQDPYLIPEGPDLNDDSSGQIDIAEQSNMHYRCEKCPRMALRRPGKSG